MGKTAIVRLVTVALLVAAFLSPAGPAAADATKQSAVPPVEFRMEIPPGTALRLFASLEDAWGRQDAEQLAALVDTTLVRIALKPGGPPTTAMTRNAASFLFLDQLRLVKTRSFRVTRFELDEKHGTAKAWAEWNGDWGGRRGARRVKVTLAARAAGVRWLLTEIRAED